ncbi:MAG: hypothetical protein PHC97_00525 [Patescibacteria group bacterium]|nr:hypothetical protein [Patescibacteria group bacterium]
MKRLFVFLIMILALTMLMPTKSKAFNDENTGQQTIAMTTSGDLSSSLAVAGMDQANFQNTDIILGDPTDIANLPDAKILMTKTEKSVFEQTVETTSYKTFGLNTGQMIIVAQNHDQQTRQYAEETWTSCGNHSP